MKKNLKNKLNNLSLKLKTLENKLEKKKIKNFKKFNKNYNKIKNILKYYEEWKNWKLKKKQTKELIKIEDIKEIAKEDIIEINSKLKELKLILIKLNKIKKKKINKIFIEIKIGVGGEESALFISDLSKMYIKYSEKKNWSTKIISCDFTNLGGYKEITIKIKGKSVYNNLKFESGVHRVQRKPLTERQNRIHTSTCKVAVFPNVKNKKFKLKKKDLKIDTFKSSGAGGQHINKTNSAIRIKHIPTNIVVECQNSRSQHENKREALKLLKLKIINNKLKKKNLNLNKKRKFLFGKGERAEKIRTYNYSKNRLTDHRIKLISHKLTWIMNGNLDYVIKYFKN